MDVVNGNMVWSKWNFCDTHFVEIAAPVHRVQTSFVPDKEQYNMTKSQLLAQMDVSMGGRVAEELVFGPDKVTTGAELLPFTYLCLHTYCTYCVVLHCIVGETMKIACFVCCKKEK